MVSTHKPYTMNHQKVLKSMREDLQFINSTPIKNKFLNKKRKIIKPLFLLDMRIKEQRILAVSIHRVQKRLSRLNALESKTNHHLRLRDKHQMVLNYMLAKKDKILGAIKC